MAVIPKIPDEASTRGIVGQICLDIRGNSSDDRTEREKDLRVKSLRYDGPLLDSVPNAQIGEEGTCKPGCRYPGGSCISRNEARRRPLGQAFESAIGDRRVVDVEDSVKVGRCKSPHTRVLPGVQPHGNDHLVCEVEDKPKSCPEGELARAHSRQELNGSACAKCATVTREPETDVDLTTGFRGEDSAVLPTIISPLLQKRSPRCTSADGVGEKTRCKTHTNASEAPGQQQRVSATNDRLLVEARRLCEDFGHWHGHNPFVKKKKSSLTLLKRASKVATASDLHLPCHFPQVAPLLLSEVKRRMNDPTKKRFMKVWNITTNFEPEEFAISNPMLCPVKDAKMAVINNLAVALPANTPVTCHYFSVVEEKEPEHRRRPIHWARSFNKHCDDTGYEAKVDLKHHSNYFARVMAEQGATFDLKAGFFQIELPSSSLFTFKDEEGNVYGLSRLPMGICTAPEIMQIITSTLGGDPTHCIPTFRSSAVVDVWIDNILFSGSSNKVNDSVTQFKANVEACKGTINWKDSVENSKELEFIGMKFDFDAKEISLSKKNKKRIASIAFSEKMQFRDLEAATARLMYASSVLNVRLAKYYFALKFIRRRLSDINKEKISRESWVTIPPSSLLSYNDWLNDVKSAKPRKQSLSTTKKSFTLWTDSSNVGWGAVLINEDTQELKVVADKWSGTDTEEHINILEAKAVKLALSLFDYIDNSVCNLKIDNTSVVATIEKGYSKSELLNAEILNIQQIAVKRNIRLTKPQYVRSADNIADYWSRFFDERQG